MIPRRTSVSPALSGSTIFCLTQPFPCVLPALSEEKTKKQPVVWHVICDICRKILKDRPGAGMEKYFG